MTTAFRRVNRRTFASLRRHRNYRLFFSGQIVSVSGTWMQNIAAAWVILELTHSPVAVGVLALCQFLPFTVFGLFAGVLVDRFDARRTVIATQASAMVLAGILAVLVVAGQVTATEVYVLTALRGVVLVLDAPARQALTFQMVGQDELPNAVALNSSLFNAARVVGPALGGLLVAVVGAGACFSLNAVSYLAVLAGLLAMRREELFPVERPKQPPKIFRGTMEALAHVRQAPDTLLALLMVLMLSTFSFNFNVLLPVLARLDARVGGQGVRRGHRDVRPRCAGRCADGGVPGTRQLAGDAVRGGRVRPGADGLGPDPLVVGGRVSAADHGRLLHAVDVQRQRDRPAVDTRPPARARDRPLLLRLQRHRPAGGLLAGWLAAQGGTELAFLVSGAAAVATAGVAATIRFRPGELIEAARFGRGA